MTDMDIAGDFGICNDMDAAGSIIIGETGTRGDVPDEDLQGGLRWYDCHVCRWRLWDMQ